MQIVKCSHNAVKAGIYVILQCAALLGNSDHSPMESE